MLEEHNYVYENDMIIKDQINKIKKVVYAMDTVNTFIFINYLNWVYITVTPY